MVEATPLLKLDPEVVARHYPLRHFRFRHTLAGDPRFELEPILRTALSCPSGLVDFHAADRTVGDGLGITRTPDMTVEQAIRCLHESEAWLQIRHVQRAPLYRDLTWQIFEEIRPQVAPLTRGVQQMVAYLVFSSPGALTPYHIDNEYNFFLHLRGVKTAHTWPGQGEGPITHADLERYYKRGFHDVAFAPELEGTAALHELHPGDGLFIPVHTPHWVRNGPEVCVSLAITFLTEALQREASIHWLNGTLRQRGFSPRPYAQSRLADEAKHLFARVARRALRHRLRPLR